MKKKKLESRIDLLNILRLIFHRFFVLELYFSFHKKPFFPIISYRFSTHCDGIGYCDTRVQWTSFLTFPINFFFFILLFMMEFVENHRIAERNNNQQVRCANWDTSTLTRVQNEYFMFHRTELHTNLGTFSYLRYRINTDNSWHFCVT